MNYVVEVEASTHDLLQQGVLAMPRGREGLDYSVVIVAPDEVSSDAEAMLMAAQMAACSSGGMPTRTTLVSWPLTDRKQEAMAKKNEEPPRKPCPGACGGAGRVDIIIFNSDGTVDKAESKYNQTCIACDGEGSIPG